MPIILCIFDFDVPEPVCNWLFLAKWAYFYSRFLSWRSATQLTITDLLALSAKACMGLFQRFLFFSYFWVATTFNEIQIADDLKKNGGYIPGVRLSRVARAEYLHK